MVGGICYRTGVDDANIRLDTGGFTINANTTINGQLNINNESEQGFIVSGDNGNTSILSTSIGTYNNFKNRSSEPILVGSHKTATFTSSGGSYTSDTINFGTIASNRTLTFKTFSASAKRPHHTTSWSATVTIRRNGSKVTSFNVYNSTTSQQTYTTQMEAEYSIVITWNIQATDSSGNSLTGQAVESSFGMYAIIPNAAYTLIGYDGIASNFSNKLWNASKFVLMNLEDAEDDLSTIEIDNLKAEDKWIISKVTKLMKEVEQNIENYDLGVALDKIYSFIWNEFCDWYIEMCKPRMYSDDEDTKVMVSWVLNYVFSNSLKLLHPFMPFVTSEIYSKLIVEDDF